SPCSRTRSCSRTGRGSGRRRRRRSCSGSRPKCCRRCGRGSGPCPLGEQGRAGVSSLRPQEACPEARPAAALQAPSVRLSCWSGPCWTLVTPPGGVSAARKDISSCHTLKPQPGMGSSRQAVGTEGLSGSPRTLPARPGVPCPVMAGVRVPHPAGPCPRTLRRCPHRI
ncbi:unnamed protein product, partial [Gulo gulo]